MPSPHNLVELMTKETTFRSQMDLLAWVLIHPSEINLKLVEVSGGGGGGMV